MLTQTVIFFSICLVFVMWWCLRIRIRYWAALMLERGWYSTIHYDRCLRIFNKLYENVNAFRVSLDERKTKNLQDEAYVYGEVTFYNFVKILEQANIKPGDVFYDLGSGGGKAVFIASLVFDLAKSYGVEKLTDLYDLSKNLLSKLGSMPELPHLLPTKKLNIEFIHDDFMRVDMSNADVIFINATCYHGDYWQDIIAKFRKLKVGTRIIMTSQRIEELGGFEEKYQGIYLMTWGLSHVSIYERV